MRINKNIIYNNKSIIFKNIKDKIVLKNSNNWEEIEKELRNKDMLNNKQKSAGIIFLNKNNQNKYCKLKQFFINNYPNLINWSYIQRKKEKYNLLYDIKF